MFKSSAWCAMAESAEGSLAGTEGDKERALRHFNFAHDLYQRARQYGLYVLRNSQEGADAAARVIRPKLDEYVRGNVLGTLETRLCPVIAST